MDLVEVLCRPSGHHTPLDEDGAATWRISDEHTVRGANWRCLELGQASKPLMTSALATVDQHLGDGRLEEPRHNSSCQARNWFIPASHRQSIQHVPQNRLKFPGALAIRLLGSQQVLLLHRRQDMPAILISNQHWSIGHHFLVKSITKDVSVPDRKCNSIIPRGSEYICMNR